LARRRAAQEVSMTKRKVLIPLDGSDYSRQILPQVQAWLKPDAHDLILIRVSEPPQGLTRASHPTRNENVQIPEFDSSADADIAAHPIYQSQKMDSAISALSDALRPERESLEAAGYTVSIEIRFGHAAKEITQCAEDSAVDLIAMTTHARAGLERLMAGSVASDVIHRATVPVLLYRPREV
jgi:nucleotide-binding universal stress UspA family protein